MANNYYTHTTYPAQGSSGASSLMRAELENIEAGFDKLLDPATHANQVMLINAAGTGQTGSPNLSFAGSTLTLNGTLAGSGLAITSPAITGGSIAGLTTPLPIASGGTGAITAAAAIAALGGLPLAGGTMTGNLSMNGLIIFFDADNDTFIRADVDDTLYFYVGGTAQMALATTAVYLNNLEVFMDTDQDSSFRMSADDVWTMKLQGIDAFIFDGDIGTPENGLIFTVNTSGGGPTIASHGPVDADIAININPKGNGALQTTAPFKAASLSCTGFLTGVVYNGILSNWSPGAINLPTSSQPWSAWTTAVVTGAAVGDVVLVAASKDLIKCTLTGKVISANTVEILLNNTHNTTDGLNLGTFDVYITVLSRT